MRACSAASGALPLSASTAVWIDLPSASSGVPRACCRALRAVTWPQQRCRAALQAVHSLLTLCEVDDGDDRARNGLGRRG